MWNSFTTAATNNNCYYTTTGTLSYNFCCNGHVWVWAGDPDYFLYDGMPCFCGQAKYNKKEHIIKQIQLLLEQL